MKYSHSGTRGRQCSEQKLLDAMHDVYEAMTEELREAQADENPGWIEHVSFLLRQQQGVIEAQEARLRERRQRERQKAKIANKRIRTFTELMQTAEREIDVAAYQQLITNERRSLKQS